MKTLKLLLLLCSAIVITGCSKDGGTISGIYILNSNNGYSIASDTLVNKAYSLAAGTYQVQRRDGFRRIRNGKIQPEEFWQEEWMAAYDKDRQVLQESGEGKVIYINADNGTLSYGGSYQRIK